VVESGTVTEVLPDGLFRLALDSGDPVVAHMAAALTLRRARIKVGHSVDVEDLTPDFHHNKRGRIVARNRGDASAAQSG
jgi:translation initiation factor IF-1